MNEATTVRVNTESEQRRERAEKLFKFLEKVNAREVFKDEQSRMKFAQETSVEKIKDFLVRLNGIILDTPIRERELVAQGSVRLINTKDGKVDYAAPHWVLKERLLEEVFTESKKLQNSKDVGLLYSAEIQALHLPRDGSGRLARLVYLLFSKDHSFDTADKEEIINSLLTRKESQVKPYVAFINTQTDRILAEQYAGLDPSDPNTPLALMMPDTPEEFLRDINTRTDLDETFRHIFQDMFEDTTYAVFACVKYLRKTNNLEKFFGVDPDSNSGVKGILVSKLIKSLTTDEVKDLTITYQGLKIAYVRLLADIIINPEKYPVNYKDTHTLKEMYVACIEKYGFVE